MSKVRKLLEFAMELGGTPDAIHPENKRALQTGEHPLGKNPAFPAHQGAGMNPHEQHAVGTYQAVMQNLQRFGGIVPRNHAQGRQAMGDAFKTLTDLKRREAAHHDQLEKLAIEAVLRIPEYKTLRRAIETGKVTIEAHLSRTLNLQGHAYADEEREEPAEFAHPQAKEEYIEKINKRRMIATLIQGATVANNYAGIYYVGDELRQIDPNLERDYKKFMAYTELGYFTEPPAVMVSVGQAGGSEGQLGDERLVSDENGNCIILARGVTFSVLVHEIIKGVMEYISLDDDEDDDTRIFVNKEADVANDEMVQMQVGPNIYRQMMDAIGTDSAEIWPRLHAKLVKMPEREFNQKLQALIAGTPEGKNWFKQVAQEIKRHMQTLEDGPNESLVSRMCS